MIRECDVLRFAVEVGITPNHGAIGIGDGKILVYIIGTEGLDIIRKIPKEWNGIEVCIKKIGELVI